VKTMAAMNDRRADRQDAYICDFILSIGVHCGPAINLRSNHLRSFSAPLDWMMEYSLDTVLHLFKEGFNDFFSQYEIDQDNPEGAVGMLRVNDTRNHIVSIHHFPKDMRMDSSYPRFIDKMNARKNRLESLLQNASSICLMADRSDTREDLLSFLRSFSNLYPHLRIRLVNMRYDESMAYKTYKKETIFDDHRLSYIEYLFNDAHQGVRELESYAFVWSQILSEYNTSDLPKIEMI